MMNLLSAPKKIIK